MKELLLGYLFSIKKEKIGNGKDFIQPTSQWLFSRLAAQVKYPQTAPTPPRPAPPLENMPSTTPQIG